jgi:HK97 family phage portal protein
MRRTLVKLLRWLGRKMAVPASPDSPAGFLDRYQRTRPPGNADLLQELKNTAWTCAALNAAVCASYLPRLYAATAAGEPAPRCRTRPLGRKALEQIRANPHLPPAVARAEIISEVLSHPLLDLLQRVNDEHNGYELLELTTLYQEIFGRAYWHVVTNELGVPESLWILPSQHVSPRREPGSQRAADFYEYRHADGTARLRPDEVIAFRYPDPRNPYAGGLSPLQACFENVCLSSAYLSFKQALWDNHALPHAVVSPADVLGEEEAGRLERQFQARFGRGQAGKILLAESALQVHILSHSMGDLAALAEHGKTKEDICNAFAVPLSYLTSETNLANLQAAQLQHLALAITPRLRRRDQKINERLLPYYDPTGRLFAQSDNPVPEDEDHRLRQQEIDLGTGTRSINEVRAERNLPPVAWGEAPWLPDNWKPVNS